MAPHQPTHHSSTQVINSRVRSLEGEYLAEYGFPSTHTMSVMGQACIIVWYTWMMDYAGALRSIKRSLGADPPHTTFRPPHVPAGPGLLHRGRLCAHHGCGSFVFGRAQLSRHLRR